jgi:hypothetical protein
MADLKSPAYHAAQKVKAAMDSMPTFMAEVGTAEGHVVVKLDIADAEALAELLATRAKPLSAIDWIA